MRLHARRLGVPVVVLAVIAGIVWSFVPGPVEVDLGRVTRGAMRVTVDEEGRTRVRERYVVSAPLGGRLRRIPLRAGDAITADDTAVAVVDPTDPTLLDARAVAEAEARVRAARAARERAGPDLERARAAHELAAKQLERARRLYATKVVSHQELDEAESRERIAAEELKAASFAGDIAQFELDVAEAALLRTRPGGADATGFEIRSPIAGRVLRVFEESETVVAAGTHLLEIADPTDLEVEIDVLSSDAVRIRPGARVLLEHWGGERPLTGRVRVVEPGGFTKVSALGVEEQRVNVIVDLLDPPDARPALGDGYRVDARIVVWEGEHVLEVPTGALFRHGEAWAVFVVRNGRARLETVEIGRQNASEAEVLGGLEEQDVVVLHPSDQVGDGVAIRAR
jgi:HlyD family secretion protein